MVHRKPRPRHSKFPKHSKKDPEQQIHWRNLEALLDRCHGDTTLMCSYPIFVFNLFTPNITCSVHMLLVFVCFSGLSVFWSFLNASYKVVCLILPLSIQSSFYCHGLGSSCSPLIQCVKYPSPGVLNNPANLFIILLTVQDRGIVFCTLSSCFFCFHIPDFLSPPLPSSSPQWPLLNTWQFWNTRFYHRGSTIFLEPLH